MLTAAAADVDVDAALVHLAAHGWARIGVVAAPDALSALRTSADALMDVPRAGLFYQHDSATGAYEDLRFRDGHIGASRAYRKIEGLERDPAMLAWIENPLFARIAAAAIAGPVAVCRAVLWNKIAQGGTELPWHQDGGKFWGLTAQPTLQVWTALDDAPVASGCVEVVPGTHAGGLATREGGTIPAALSEPRLADAIMLPAVAGEVLLLHNLVWHRSRRNTTDHARRALSVCLMSNDVRCTRTRRAPRQFRRVFAAPSGPGSP